MKIVLQSKGSSAFVEDLDGSWTKDHERAHVFANGLEALFFCFRERMNNMQMVALFHDQRLNFSVPVANVRIG
jgi:hypothetical protein